MKKVEKGINVIIKVADKPVAGQLGATFTQSANSINVTNKINPEWQESLIGTKNWGLQCNGLYILNSESLSLLEDAFMTNKMVSAEFTLSGMRFKGQCLIVDFPFSAVYDNSFKYTLKLLGTGELQYETI